MIAHATTAPVTGYQKHSTIKMKPEGLLLRGELLEFQLSF